MAAQETRTRYYKYRQNIQQKLRSLPVALIESD